ncbi:hypothetical protein Btru_077221 [Bulinus truncatus]|nr:hypothetical protein Btru_077221 [Bulinus truncatus]
MKRSSQEAGPAMYYDENFMMRKKKTRGLARNRSLDSLLNQFSEKQLGNSPYPEKQLEGIPPYQKRKQQNNDGSRLSFENHPDLLNRNGTDYSLLGCVAKLDLLNKNFMQPARGRKSNGLNLYSDQFRWSVHISGHPTVTVTMPAHAVSQNVRIYIWVCVTPLKEFISDAVNLTELAEQHPTAEHRFVNNILAMGPIVYHTDRTSVSIPQAS